MSGFVAVLAGVRNQVCYRLLNPNADVRGLSQAGINFLSGRISVNRNMAKVNAELDFRH
jgi:hypothetical protein